ncbi:uncharacterized protein [Erythrolamprus reginae]|uniref:uncharacterized protein n=1 Tax=Erythrolamprus reginae TaxID=121349 RepID=UPI00396C524F
MGWEHPPPPGLLLGSGISGHLGAQAARRASGVGAVHYGRIRCPVLAGKRAGGRLASRNRLFSSLLLTEGITWVRRTAPNGVLAICMPPLSIDSDTFVKNHEEAISAESSCHNINPKYVEKVKWQLLLEMFGEHGRRHVCCGSSPTFLKMFYRRFCLNELASSFFLEKKDGFIYADGMGLNRVNRVNASSFFDKYDLSDFIVIRNLAINATIKENCGHPMLDQISDIFTVQTAAIPLVSGDCNTALRFLHFSGPDQPPVSSPITYPKYPHPLLTTDILTPFFHPCQAQSFLSIICSRHMLKIYVS